MTIEEWGDKTGLKKALETHLEYGDDFVRLALISFRQHIKNEMDNIIKIIEGDKDTFKRCGRDIKGHFRAIMLIKEYNENTK